MKILSLIVFFFLLGIIDMNDHEEIRLGYYDGEKIQACNFNSSGNLILNYKTKGNKINIVRISSMQKNIKRATCQNTYMLPKKAEVIMMIKFSLSFSQKEIEIFFL